MTPDTTDLGGSEVGGYVLGRVLGEGGAAVVYEAEGHDGPVALKILNAESARQPNVVASFEYEHRVLGRLDHPGIVGVHGSGAERGLVWAALDVVEGPTFDRHLSRVGRLPQADVAELALELLSILGHVHRAGYVHRDFKPANLVRTTEGRLVLLDFGTVVRADTSIDYERGSYGTVAYQAPEQIRQAATIDGRCLRSGRPAPAG